MKSSCYEYADTVDVFDLGTRVFKYFFPWNELFYWALDSVDPRTYFALSLWLVGSWKYYQSEGQLVYKLIGLKSMYSFFLE